jgi:integrase
MGSVEKRQRQLKGGKPGDVHWRAHYRDGDGRLRSQTFDRKVDAENFLERNGADIQRGDWIDPAMRRKRFDDWADEWWQTTIRLRPNTRRGYWRLLNGHVLAAFGGWPMASIDYMDVERFIATKLKAGHSMKHVREMVTIISLIMKCAVKAGGRKDNPAAGHALSVQRKRIRQGDALTMAQSAALIAQVTPWYRPAVWTLIFTGMRPAELCGLLVGDVDLIRGLVHVDRTWSPIPAYDGGERQHLEGPAKSEAGERSIPVPSWLCEDIAALLAQRTAEVGSPPPKDHHLFVNQDGRPINRDTFRQKIIRPALRRAGLPETFRTYDFRHSHASQLIDDGANPLAVAQRLGHTDPAMTLRVYGHLFDGAQEALTDRLEERRKLAGQQQPGGDVVIPFRGRGQQMGNSGQQKQGQRRVRAVNDGQP